MKINEYLVIGFNEEYQNEGIEPYYIELRHENEHDKDEILAWKYTETDAWNEAQRISIEKNIPLSKYMMI